MSLDDEELTGKMIGAAIEVGLHRLDLFVADRILVKLKAVKTIEDVPFAVAVGMIREVGFPGFLAPSESAVV